MTQLSPQQFIEQANNFPVIDVRSEGEYEYGHIPGSISIPLFNNEERAKIGTIYKQNGKNQAVIKGLEFVGSKLTGFTKQALKLKSETILLYCWRGGMRSNSMAWLFETVDLKTCVLQGGYKAYRNYILDSFANSLKLIVLCGYTGAGKTDILTALEQHDEQVINLENLANHKGSAFGALGQPNQPITEMFENILFEKLDKLDKSLPIWIEDEGNNIGSVFINSNFWLQMQKAPVVIADTDYNVRLNRLLKDYACFSKEELKTAIKKIEKRLGYDNCNKALKACDIENYRAAAEICLTYYDKAYDLQLSTRVGNALNQVPKVKTNEINTDVINNFKNLKWKL